MVRPKVAAFVALVIDINSDRNFVKKILKRIVVHNGLLKSNDTVELYFVNHKEGSRGFIKQDGCLDIHSEHIINIYDEISDDDIKVANWLDCLNMILNTFEYQENMHTNQCLYISDFKTPLKPSQGAISQFVKKIHDSRAYFIAVVDQEVCFDKKMLYLKEDFLDAMAEIKVPESTDGLDFMIKLLIDAKGIVIGPDYVLDVMGIFRNYQEKTPFNEPLTLGEFKFPTVTSRFVFSPPSYLKKAAISKQSFNVIKDDLEDTIGPEVYKEDILSVYKYYNEVVNIPADVAKKDAYQGPRMFKLVGFVSEDTLPEIYFAGDEAHIIRLVEDKKLGEAEKHKKDLFLKLIKDLKEKKLYALALRAYSRNNCPKLYVLLPKTNWFLMTPFVTAIAKVFQVKPAVPDDNIEISDEISDALKTASLNIPPIHPQAELGVSHKKRVDHLIDTDVFSKIMKFY